MIIYLVTNDTLGIGQAVEVDRPPGLVVDFTSDILNLTQTLESNIKAGSVFDFLNLQQTLNISRPLHVEDFLPLNQLVARPIELACSNLLAMTHLARPVTRLDLIQYISFAQSVEVGFGLFGIITFDDSVAVQIIHLESLTDTLTLNQGVSVYKYNDPSFIQIIIPPLPAFTPVILTQGSLNLTLDIPDFGNSNTIEHTRINRTSRAGTLQVFRDPDWPKTEVLEMSFSKLSEAKAKNFLSFLEDTLGKIVTLVDHEGVTWNGIIMNPENEIICNDRSCEPFQTKLIFEGVKA